MHAFLFLAAAIAAQADVAAVAQFPTVSPDSALPKRDVTLPTNGRLLAFVGGNGPTDGVSFDRLATDGTPTTLHADLVKADIGSAFIVTLAPLTAGDSLVIQPTCANFCSDVFTFTVGDHDDTTAPAWDDDVIPARFQTNSVTDNNPIFPGTAGYFIQGCLPHVTDEGDVALKVEIEGQTALLPVAGTAACPTPVSFELLGGHARQACIHATAVDVAGNETVFPNDVCVQLGDPADNGGCAVAPSSSSSTPATAGVLLFALRLGARRRRS